MSSWDQANRREKLGLVWRNRKKISQIINDYLYLPFFLLIILSVWMRAAPLHFIYTRSRWNVSGVWQHVILPILPTNLKEKSGDWLTAIWVHEGRLRIRWCLVAAVRYSKWISWPTLAADPPPPGRGSSPLTRPPTQLVTILLSSLTRVYRGVS